MTIQNVTLRDVLFVGLILLALAILTVGCASSPYHIRLSPTGPVIDREEVTLLDGSLPGETSTVGLDGGCLVLTGGLGEGALNPARKALCLPGVRKPER
jgi:hypothetical protein